jgi:TolA-binding protein
VKKRTFLGVGIGILVFSVLIGIASLPDEVLIESSEIEELQTVSPEMQLVPTDESSDFANAEIDALKQEIIELKNELVELKTNSQEPEEPLVIQEEEPAPEKELEEKTQEASQEESQGKLITVNIQDGVGSKSR